MFPIDDKPICKRLKVSGHRLSNGNCTLRHLTSLVDYNFFGLAIVYILCNRRGLSVAILEVKQMFSFCEGSQIHCVKKTTISSRLDENNLEAYRLKALELDDMEMLQKAYSIIKKINLLHGSSFIAVRFYQLCVGKKDWSGSGGHV